MRAPRTAEEWSARARDLERCEIGLALAPARDRPRFARHRRALMAVIRAANVAEDIASMDDDMLLAELTGDADESDISY